MFISNFYGFFLDEFGMLSRHAGFSATAELSCSYCSDHSLPHVGNLDIKTELTNTVIKHIKHVERLWFQLWPRLYQSMSQPLINPSSVYPWTVSGSTTVHTASIPWQLRCCSQPSHPLVDIVTYSASRFPVTVTNTEQMPKTMFIPAVALMS